MISEPDRDRRTAESDRKPRVHEQGSFSQEHKEAGSAPSVFRSSFHSFNKQSNLGKPSRPFPSCLEREGSDAAPPFSICSAIGNSVKLFSTAYLAGNIPGVRSAPFTFYRAVVFLRQRPGRANLLL